MTLAMARSTAKAAQGSTEKAGAPKAGAAPDRAVERRRGDGERTAPRIVHEVLDSPGEPLEPSVRAEMEGRFGHDFSRVRIHRDAAAIRSAQSLGALGYSYGSHVVLDTSAGGDVAATLRHELAHVALSAPARAVSPVAIAPPSHPHEGIADQAVRSHIGIPRAGVLNGNHEATLFLRRDTRLTRLISTLASLAQSAPGHGSTDELVAALVQHFSGVNLWDPDNLTPVADAVAEHFPENVFFAFLQRIETDIRLSRTSADERRMQATIRMLQVPRRGPYGTVTPFPVTEVVTGTLGRGVAHAARGMSSFFEGIVSGMRDPSNTALVDALSQRLAEATVVNMVAPVVFASGAVVGIGQDIWQGIRGILELPELLRKLEDIFKMIVAPTGPAMARLMGRQIGRQWRSDLQSLANLDPIRFTFQLGRLVGPTIVYAIMALLGVTAIGSLSAAALRLVRLMRRFPALMRRIGRLARHFRHRPHARSGRHRSEPEPGQAPSTRTSGAGRARRRESATAEPRSSRGRSTRTRRAPSERRPGETASPDRSRRRPRTRRRRRSRRRPMRGGRTRPRLPRGRSAPRLPPERLRSFRNPVSRANVERHRAALELYERDPRAAGHRYQQVVAADLNGVEVQEAFSRPGRRMDVGTSHEVTLEGWRRPFNTHKLDQLWLDMVDNGEVLLTVPRLSPRARDQLARLGAQVEAETGRSVLIVVRETLSNEVGSP